MKQEQYFLNAAPIIIQQDSIIPIGTFDYTDDTFKKLKEEYGESYIFYRDNSINKILAIPTIKEASLIGEVVDINIAERASLTNLLVRLSLKNYFEKTALKAISLMPLTVFDPRKNNQSILPDKETLPEWLNKVLVYEFQMRSILDSHGKRVSVLACDVRAKNFIDTSCETLVKSGIDITGKYVQVTTTPHSEFLYPRRKLVGKVQCIDNDKIILADNLSDYETVNLSEAYLEPRNENIKHCVFSLLGSKANNFWNQIENNEIATRQGDIKFDKVQKVLKRISDAKIELAPHVLLRLGDMFGSSSFNFKNIEKIAQPTFIFDAAQSRTDTWHQKGLDNNGPYDQFFFSPKKLRIAVICNKTLQGRVEQFLNKFLDGMPKEFGGGKYPPYKHGFVRRFKLEKPEINFFPTDDLSYNAYVRSCTNALAKASNENMNWDLVFVQVKEEFKTLAHEENPYLACKAFFFKRDIPVQSFTDKTLTTTDGALVWSLNQMSLASYAKLGGQPWLLKADNTIAHELVIGLGSCTLSESRTGNNQRIVGITTVFSGDGNYILNNQTKAVPYEEYSKELIDSLTNVLTRIKKDQNWQENDPVRLVFHTFKPLKNAEIDAVKEAVAKLSLRYLEFAFIHFADDHPFKVFDILANGVGKNKKGKYAPDKGLCFLLNENESLLCFVGAKEIKKETHGMPEPILLKLHPNSTFSDMTYLSRQAFCFAAHNWRSFYASHLPITIRYSELIASLLIRMRKVSNWDEASVYGKIGRTRWFL